MSNGGQVTLSDRLRSLCLYPYIQKIIGKALWYQGARKCFESLRPCA